MRRAFIFFLVLAACTADSAKPSAEGRATGAEVMTPATTVALQPALDARLPAEVRSATFAMG
jgi:hypothetical protein